MIRVRLTRHSRAPTCPIPSSITSGAHHSRSLPVVDRARRVFGIVTLMDSMKHVQLDHYDGFDRKLRALIKRNWSLHSEKPEVIGQIMTTRVVTATEGMHIVELVPKLSDAGLHHIPIVNDERRLVAPLYRGRVAEESKPLRVTH